MVSRDGKAEPFRTAFPHSLSAQTPMRLRRTTDDENGGLELAVARRGPVAVQAYVESGGWETEICCGDNIPSHRLARAA